MTVAAVPPFDNGHLSVGIVLLWTFVITLTYILSLYVWALCPCLPGPALLLTPSHRSSVLLSAKRCCSVIIYAVLCPLVLLYGLWDMTPKQNRPCMHDDHTFAVGTIGLPVSSGGVLATLTSSVAVLCLLNVFATVVGKAVYRACSTDTSTTTSASTSTKQVVTFVKAVLVAPVCEEIVFRGCMLPVWQSCSTFADHPWITMLCTAAVFALAHGHGLVGNIISSTMIRCSRGDGTNSGGACQRCFYALHAPARMTERGGLEWNVGGDHKDGFRRLPALQHSFVPVSKQALLASTVPPLLLGVVNGYVFLRSGSLLACIMCHMLCNAWVTVESTSTDSPPPSPDSHFVRVGAERSRAPKCRPWMRHVLGLVLFILWAVLWPQQAAYGGVNSQTEAGVECVAGGWIHNEVL